jgi:hypothetical protein
VSCVVPPSVCMGADRSDSVSKTELGYWGQWGWGVCELLRKNYEEE